MPGPAPKPEGRRQRRNRRDVGAVVVPFERAVPEPDRKWLKCTRDRWGSYWTSHVAALVELSDMPCVERYSGLVDERERLARLVRAEPFVDGKGGMPAPSPLWRLVRQADSELRQLEDRLGMSPLARLKLGVTFGQAHRSLDELNRGLLADVDESEWLDGDLDDPRACGGTRPGREP